MRNLQEVWSNIVHEYITPMYSRIRRLSWRATEGGDRLSTGSCTTIWIEVIGQIQIHNHPFHDIRSERTNFSINSGMVRESYLHIERIIWLWPVLSTILPVSYFNCDWNAGLCQYSRFYLRSYGFHSTCTQLNTILASMFDGPVPASVLHPLSSRLYYLRHLLMRK